MSSIHTPQTSQRPGCGILKPKSLGAAQTPLTHSLLSLLSVAEPSIPCLAGNISNMRLPCAAVAQSVAGVEEGTRRGELIATVGIGVSIWFSTIAVFIGAVATGWIVTFFPPAVQDAFRRFLLPAVFGAVFGQFALRGPKYAPIALILALVPLLLKWPAYYVIPIAVFATILFGRLLYRPGNTSMPMEEMP